MARRAASHFRCSVCKGAFRRLTCGVERAFVSVVRPLLQQAEGLSHVICRSDGRARVAARLLQEAEGIVGSHHLPAHPFKTPGRRKEQRLNKKLDSFDCFLIWKPDLLGSGISVSVIDQFLCVFKAAPHERVVEICSCKIMGMFFNHPERRRSRRFGVCDASIVAYLLGWSERESGRCPTRGRQREAFLEESKQKELLEYQARWKINYSHVMMSLPAEQQWSLYCEDAPEFWILRS